MLDVFNAVSKSIIQENMVLNLIMLPIILEVLKNVLRFALRSTGLDILQHVGSNLYYLSPNSTACNTQTNTVIRREINKNKFRVLGVLRWQSHFFCHHPPRPPRKLKIRAKGWSLTSEKFPAIIDVINLWGAQCFFQENIQLYILRLFKT